MPLIIQKTGVIRSLALAACCALVLVCSAVHGAEAESDGASGSDAAFSQYKILLDRNIFDATRDRPRPQQERPRAPRPTPAPNPDYLDVTGAFMQGDQAIVFFEGSKADFNQAVGAGAQIAGAQLAEVNLERVILDFGAGARVTVPVGSRLMIQPDGTTSVVERQRSEQRAPRATAADRRDGGANRGGQDQQGRGGDLRGMIQGMMGGGGMEQFGFPGGMFGGGGMPGMGAMPEGMGGGGGPGGRGGGRQGGPQAVVTTTVQTQERTLSEDEQAAILERLRARREEEMGQ